MTAAADLGSVLRGDPASGDELRQALAEIRADGFVLVHRDTLATIAAAGPDDGTFARRLAVIALLSCDTDMLAETLVDAIWDTRCDLEGERAA